MTDSKAVISDWFKSLQSDICMALEKADGQARFKEDPWDRPGGGGGITRVIDGGQIIEKGGVNFSAVSGITPKTILNALDLKEADFFATGVSIVLHPYSPMVPIIHMNVRYFEMSNGTWWFGGGMDLTPHYVDDEDAAFFHQQLKTICDTTDPHYYKRFKAWADDYFYLQHRKETRGIGGIFFDRLGPEEKTKEELFDFVKSVAKGFVPIYSHLMDKNKNLPFDDNEKHWQMLRRGRYVEFNLVWDKGTKFGLDTDGRTESILMSLPPHASWTYDYKTLSGSKEEETKKKLVKKIDWLKKKE